MNAVVRLRQRTRLEHDDAPLAGSTARRRSGVLDLLREIDDMVGNGGERGVVRRDHQGRTLVGRGAQSTNYRGGAVAVELRGRLVDHDERHAAGERDRERRTRQLASRQLSGARVQAPGETDGVEDVG